MPRSIIYVALILTALSLIPLAFIARARVTTSTQPRIQIVPDMDNQPRFKSQQVNPLFPDGRELRAPVAGSVAFGELDADDQLNRGLSGGDWTTSFPLPLTSAFLKRGQERFDIYCAVCHGFGGAGDGTVSRSADQLAEGTWIPPLDLTSAPVRERPVGHIFNTITNGIRNMPAYGPQIPVEDRWAIVAYVRALQRSTNASLQDVPPDIQPSLK
jgi:mono/diheme cytochrome c family protein